MQPRHAEPLLSLLNGMLAFTNERNCDFCASPSHFARMWFAHNYGRSGTGRICRWVAMSAGWKMTAAARVVRSDRAISLPMLDVPG